VNYQDLLSKHCLELLNGGSAHISLEDAIKDFPIAHINTRIENSPHTPWELLEHIRIAQWDILDFSVNPKYREMKWPNDYWPKKDGTKAEWKASVKQILRDRKSIAKLITDDKADLFAPFKWGTGQTLLREILLVADHNAYHLGQLVLIRRIVE
jgi:hypothetical protein